MARRRNKGQERSVAAGRIARLTDAARAEALGPDRDLADRYIATARRIATRYQMRLPAATRESACKCGAYRRSGQSRSRIHAGRIVTTCLVCGHVRRRPLEST